MLGNATAYITVCSTYCTCSSSVLTSSNAHTHGSSYHSILAVRGDDALMSNVCISTYTTSLCVHVVVMYTFVVVTIMALLPLRGHDVLTSSVCIRTHYLVM